MRARACEPDVDFELSASSDKADAAAMAGAGTSAEPESSYDHKTPKETDAHSSLVGDPEGVAVSVRSSSHWEAVTTTDATFLGVALGEHAARGGVEVPGGTYSGSRSSFVTTQTGLRLAPTLTLLCERTNQSNLKFQYNINRK